MENSLDQLLDADDTEVLAIQIDYRPIFNQEKRAIVANAFSGQGLGDDEAREIVRPEISALLEEARRYFPKQNIEKLNEALSAFSARLLERVSAHQAEKRKNGSFASQIEKWIARDEFRRRAYGRGETLGLGALCRDGNIIVEVDFDYITVERDGTLRQIPRLDMIAATMPSTSPSVESWRRTGDFVSERKIQELREREEKKAFAAAHPRSGTGIMDERGQLHPFGE